MQPLLLMKQTLEAPYDPGTLLLNGSHVKMNRLAQLFSYIGANDVSNSFSIGIHLGQGLKLVSQYSKALQHQIHVSKVTHHLNKSKITYFPNMSQQDSADALYEFYRPINLELVQAVKDESRFTFQHLKTELFKKKKN
jgi:hypothetical protein